MSAQKARLIYAAYKGSNHGDARAQIADSESGGRYWVSAEELSRVELIRLAGLLDCGDQRQNTNQTILEAIESKLTGDTTYFDISKQIRPTVAAAKVVDTTAGMTATASTTATATATASTAGVNDDAAAMVAQGLAAMLRGGTPIDETTVRAIVAEEIAKADTTDATLAIIKDGIESIETGLDERINDAVTAAVANGPRPIIVNMPNREPVKIEGSTHEVLPRVLTALGAGVNVWLYGPAGTGKSTIGQQCAEALGIKFAAISCHPQMAASAMFGFKNAHGEDVRTPFWDCYEHGGLFLVDEIDNSHPSVLAALNQALSNGHCAFAGGMVTRHKDFRCVAAANTFGTGPNSQYVGRVKLDAATLDRFVRIAVNVDERLERLMVLGVLPERDADRWLAIVRTMRTNVNEAMMEVVVSPRTALDGARLIAAGWTAEEAAVSKVLAPLGVDQKTKVERGIDWSAWTAPSGLGQVTQAA